MSVSLQTLTDPARRRVRGGAPPILATIKNLLILEVRLARRLAPLRVAMALVPLVMVIFLSDAMRYLVGLDGYLLSNGTEHGVAGLAVLFCYVNLPFFCWSAYDEHGFGTWDRLRCGIVAPHLILISKVLFMSAYLMIMFVCTYVGGLALGMQVTGSVTGWLITAALTSVVASIYALMLYVLLPTGNLFIIVSHAGCLLMGGFAGAIVPSHLLPPWVQHISPILPQYWSVRAMRKVSLDGLGFTSILSELLMIVGFGIVFATVAIRRFDPARRKRPLSE